MAKLIPYDVTGVEESGGGTGVKAPPKVYVAEIMRCSHRTQKKDGSPANDLEIALNVGAAYDWLFTYVGLSEAADWKLAEFVRAVGLKDKGRLDPEKMVGKIIRVKVNPGEYGGSYSPDVGRLMKAQPNDKVDNAVSEISSQTASDEPEEDESDTEDDVPFVTDADGDKVYSDPSFEPSREGDEGVGSYDDWADDDLAAECSDRDITLPGGRGNKRDKMIKALRAEDAEVSGADDDDEPLPDDEAAAAAEEGDDYDEWDLDRLKGEWEERQMGDLPAIRGRNAADRIKTAIIEELRKDDAENPFEA